MNPLLDFSGLPKFAAIRPEHVAPAVEELLRTSRAVLAEVTRPGVPAQWDAFVAPLDANPQVAGARVPRGVGDDLLNAAQQRMCLRGIVERHAKETSSPLATRLLASWQDSVASFRKVMPRDYARVLAVLDTAKAEGLDEDATATRVMESVRG